MRMVFIEKVSGVTAKLAVLDCPPPLQHPLIARQLGKTICYEKYLYFDLSQLTFLCERAWSLQALFQIFEGHPNKTKIICITFYQFDVFSGADPDKPCVFPFSLNNGVTFNSCTKLDADEVSLFVSNIWNDINQYTFRPGVPLVVPGVTVGLAVLQKILCVGQLGKKRC